MPTNKMIKTEKDIKKATTPKIPVPKKSQKRLLGTATRDSLSKTVPVLISYTNVHPLYQKRFATSQKILAHTETDVKKGQKVTIEESRKVSKNKAWKVVSVKVEEIIE